ncbi:MAG TPA: hypothetical protein VNL69_09040, partial [Bacteroidota bacterium]|nr:hypothetical protein [Bacteroidota bacterium]
QTSTEVQDPSVQFQTSVVPTQALAKPLDESRLYHYKYAEVNPDSVLMALWMSGVPVVQGWLPLDNICMGPIGPRFTVELEKTDVRVEKFDFLPGSGRLLCATKVRNYRIVPR